MVRVDVFFVEGEGYYLVPIYVADTVSNTLPNRAIIAGKTYDLWKEMNDHYFIFSLYPNDMIRVVSAKDIKLTIANKESTLPNSMTCRETFLYYKGTDISTGAITAVTHDNTYKLRGLGVKTLRKIEKYTVDVLGNIQRVKAETRTRFQ